MRPAALALIGAAVHATLALRVSMDAVPPQRRQSRHGSRGAPAGGPAPGRGRGGRRQSTAPRYWVEEDSAFIAAERRRKGRPSPYDGDGDNNNGGRAGRHRRAQPSWTSEAGGGQKHVSFYSPRTFAEAGASDEMQAALRACSAKTPSNIQALCYSHLLGGNDAIIADQTGSGKTLAYLAPVVQALREIEAAEGRTPAGQIRALVMLPTSELAQQVLKVAKALAASGVPFRSSIITGEHKWATQRRCADNGLELLVATPGRLNAHLTADSPSFSVSAVRRVVLDEVDVLYEDPDFDQLWFELRRELPPRAAHTFVTATLPPTVQGAIERDFPLAKLIKGPGLHQTRAGVRQKLIDCSQDSRPASLERAADPAPADPVLDLKMSTMLEELAAEPVLQTLVFCNTIASCRRVENALRRRDRRGSHLELHVFHGAIPPEQRKEALDRFTRQPDGGSADERPRLLVCTDRASRGMDFPQVQHVVLFDFPRDGVEYVRRVGRATRGGNAPGRVTSLVLGRQLPYAKALMKANEAGEAIDMLTHG